MAIILPNNLFKTKDDITDINFDTRRGILSSSQDLRKYESLGGDNKFPLYSSDTDAMDETLARNQGTGELMAKAIGRTFTDFVGMGISSVGALAHGTAMFDENRERNILESIGKSLTDAGHEAMPIYQTKEAQGGFALTDGTYWASNFSNVFSSLSMLIPGMIGIKALQGVSKLGAMAVKANRANKITNAVKGFDKLTHNTAFESVIGGITGTHADAIMSSTETGQQAYEEAIQNGMEEQDAKAYAGEITRRGYIGGLSSAAMNIAEWGVLLSPAKRAMKAFEGTAGKEMRKAAFDLKKSGNAADNILGESIEQSVGKSKSLLSKGLGFAKIAPIEAVEEVWMEGAQDEARHEIDVKYGLKEDSDFGSRLSGYLSSNKYKDVAFWGAAGGLAMQGASTLVSNISNAKWLEKQTKFAADYIERAKKTRSDLVEIEALKSKNQTYKAESIYQKITNDMVDRGMQDGTLDMSIDMLKNRAKLDWSTLSDEQKVELNKEGITEEGNDIAQNLVSRLERAKEIYKKEYDKDFLTDTNISKEDIEYLGNEDIAQDFFRRTSANHKIAIETNRNIVKEIDGNLKQSEKQFDDLITTKNFNEGAKDALRANYDIAGSTSEIENLNKLRVEFQKQLTLAHTQKGLTTNPAEKAIILQRINDFQERVDNIDKTIESYKTDIASSEQIIKGYEEKATSENATAADKETYGEYTGILKDPTLFKTHQDNKSLTAERKAIASNITDRESEYNKFQTDGKYRTKLLSDALKINKEKDAGQINVAEEMLRSMKPQDTNFEKNLTEIDTMIKTLEQIKGSKETVDKLKAKKVEINQSKQKYNEEQAELIKKQKVEERLAKEEERKAAKDNKGTEAATDNKDLLSYTPEKRKRYDDLQEINDSINEDIELNDTTNIVATNEVSDTFRDDTNINTIKSLTDKATSHKFANDSKNLESIVDFYLNMDETNKKINEVAVIKEIDGKYVATIKNGNLKEVEQYHKNLLKTATKALEDIKTIKAKDGGIQADEIAPVEKRIIEKVKHISKKIKAIQEASVRVNTNDITIDSIIDKMNNPEYLNSDKGLIELSSEINSISNLTDRTLLYNKLEALKGHQSLSLDNTGINFTVNDLQNRIDAIVELGKFNIVAEAYLKHFPYKARPAQYIDLMLAVYNENPDLVESLYTSTHLHLNNINERRNQGLKPELIVNPIGINFYDRLDWDKYETRLTKGRVEINELITNLGIINRRLKANTREGVYAPLIDDTKISSSDFKRDDIYGTTNLDSDSKFADLVKVLYNLPNAVITLDVQGETFNILADGKKIGELSTLDFDYNGIIYSQDVNGEKVFANPFEAMFDNNDISETFAAAYNILNDIWEGVPNASGTNYTEFGLAEFNALKTDSYNDVTTQSRNVQSKLYNYISSFFTGSSLTDAKEFNKTLRHIISPVFVTRNSTIKVNAHTIRDFYKVHIDRFHKDFEHVKSIRSNPDNVILSFENITTPDIIYDKNTNHLLSDTIKRDENNSVRIAIIPKGGQLTFIDPVSGSTYDTNRIKNADKILATRDKDHEFMYTVIESASGDLYLHQINVARMQDMTIDNDEYRDYSKRSVDFITNEFIKLLYYGNDVSKTNGFSAEQILNNLDRLTIIMGSEPGKFNDYFSFYDNRYSDGRFNPNANIKLEFTVVEYNNDTNRRERKTIILNSRNENGKHFVSVVEAPYGYDKSLNAEGTNQQMKELGVFHFSKNGSNKGLYDLLATLKSSPDDVGGLATNMLRNFKFDKDRVTTDEIIDPLTIYDETPSKFNTNDKASDNEYMDYVLRSGALRTNIAAIKQDGEVLSNFNYGNNAIRKTSLHLKVENKPEVKLGLEIFNNIVTVGDLKNADWFADYVELLDGINSKATVTIGDIGTDLARITDEGNIIISDTIVENLSKTERIQTEVVHELIHARLDNSIKSFDQNKRDSLKNDISAILGKLLDVYFANDGTLTEQELSYISGLLFSENLLNLGKKIKNTKDAKLTEISEVIDAFTNEADFGKLQELFTWALTKPPIFEAFSKIGYIEIDGVDSKETLWDRLIKVLAKLFNINLFDDKGNIKESLLKSVIDTLKKYDNLNLEVKSNKTKKTLVDNELAKLIENKNKEINNLQKLNFKLIFISPNNLVNNDNEIENKLKQDEIKDKYKDLLSLIKCINGK